VKLPKDLAALEALAAEVAEAIKVAEDAGKPKVGDEFWAKLRVGVVNWDDYTQTVYLETEEDEGVWVSRDQINSIRQSQPNPRSASAPRRGKRKAS
jgi:hypothetical protein